MGINTIDTKKAGKEDGEPERGRAWRHRARELLMNMAALGRSKGTSVENARKRVLETQGREGAAEGGLELGVHPKGCRIRPTWS